MKTIRMGAIGCGYWGPNLIRNFVEIPDSDMVAVADLSVDRLNHMQNRYPSIQLASPDYSDLFDMNLEAVVVATPPQTHYAVVRDCLMHGLHVLVEKPVTLNSQDALDLIRLAKERNRTLMVGHTFLYNSAVRALKKLVDSGELGEIYYVDAVRVSLGLYQTCTNVVWDLAPHDISILVYLFGPTVLGVCAQANDCLEPGVLDMAYLNLRFDHRLSAHLRMSWLDPCKVRQITIVGSRKMALYNDMEPLEKIRIYDKGVEAFRRTDTYGEFQFAYHYGDVIIPYINQQEPLRVECQHFLECIHEGKTPLSDGVNGLYVVEVLEAAQRSLDAGSHMEAVLQREVEHV